MISEADLAKAPTAGSTWLLADWIEFQVLCSHYKSYRVNDLVRISDEDQDSENQDIGAQDSLNEQYLEEALLELSLRIDCLGEAYPFSFDASGNHLTLNDNINPGGYVYLYCLIFSHINRDDVLTATPSHTNDDRDLMQICATLAAAGDISGNAVSFGFPRPDHSNFLDALKNTYHRMGEGSIVDNVPPGAPRNEKDGRVDIVAWGNQPDGGAGRMYVLGQVATGDNWSNKSIRGEIDPFHNIWFSQSPASTPIPSMFIPFCLDVKQDETLNDVIYIKTYIFGTLYYRYRLPLHANIGYNLANTGNDDLYIERFNEFNKVTEYVESFCPAL